MSENANTKKSEYADLVRQLFKEYPGPIILPQPRDAHARREDPSALVRRPSDYLRAPRPVSPWRIPLSDRDKLQLQVYEAMGPKAIL